MFKTPKVGPAKEDPGGLKGSPQRGLSQELRILMDGNPSGLRSRGGPPRPSSKEVQDAGGPSRLPRVPQNVGDHATNWSCSVIGLLCICAILFLLIILMNLKVAMLEKRTKEEADLWQWKILTLTEVFRDLHIGKVPSCSICKIQWMQVSTKCFFFRNRAMSWHSSQTFCQEENANLMVVTNREEMQFLRFQVSTHYYLDPKTYEYDKFWVGLAYDVVERRWMWLDGTAFKPARYATLGYQGCAYVQNQSLRSQPCGQVAKSICETTVQFGWDI